MNPNKVEQFWLMEIFHTSANIAYGELHYDSEKIYESNLYSAKFILTNLRKKDIAERLLDRRYPDWKKDFLDLYSDAEYIFQEDILIF